MASAGEEMMVDPTISVEGAAQSCQVLTDLTRGAAGGRRRLKLEGSDTI